MKWRPIQGGHTAHPQDSAFAQVSSIMTTEACPSENWICSSGDSPLYASFAASAQVVWSNNHPQHIGIRFDDREDGLRGDRREVT